MCISLLKAICEFAIFQLHPSLPKTRAIIKAFVDMRIPISYENKNDKKELLSEALRSEIYKYHIWSLNHQLSVSLFKINIKIKLANSTAKMLDVAANQLIELNKNQRPINCKRYVKYGPFVSLSPNDRYRAINLLEHFEMDLLKLPIPFLNRPDLILLVIDAINLFTTLGYYFEWIGYGDTKIYIPSNRKLKYYPLCWEQIGYPGPSKGYRALRSTKINDNNC